MEERREVGQPDRPAEIEQQEFPEFEQSTEHPQGDDTRVVGGNAPAVSGGMNSGDQVIL